LERSIVQLATDPKVGIKDVALRDGRVQAVLEGAAHLPTLLLNGIY
jgi:hypothetical protein